MELVGTTLSSPVGHRNSPLDAEDRFSGGGDPRSISPAQRSHEASRAAGKLPVGRRHSPFSEEDRVPSRSPTAIQPAEKGSSAPGKRPAGRSEGPPGREEYVSQPRASRAPSPVQRGGRTSSTSSKAPVDNRANPPEEEERDVQKSAPRAPSTVSYVSRASPAPSKQPAPHISSPSPTRASSPHTKPPSPGDTSPEPKHNNPPSIRSQLRSLADALPSLRTHDREPDEELDTASCAHSRRAGSSVIAQRGYSSEVNNTPSQRAKPRESPDSAASSGNDDRHPAFPTPTSQFNLLISHLLAASKLDWHTLSRFSAQLEQQVNATAAGMQDSLAELEGEKEARTREMRGVLGRIESACGDALGELERRVEGEEAWDAVGGGEEEGWEDGGEGDGESGEGDGDSVQSVTPAEQNEAQDKMDRRGSAGRQNGNTSPPPPENSPPQTSHDPIATSTNSSLPPTKLHFHSQRPITSDQLLHNSPPTPAKPPLNSPTIPPTIPSAEAKPIPPPTALGRKRKLRMLEYELEEEEAVTRAEEARARAARVKRRIVELDGSWE